MNKKTFKDLWEQLVALVEDQEHCDEENEHKDENVMMFLNSVLDEDLDPVQPNVKEFLVELGVGTYEFYNSEYASESPGSRSEHRKGYKDSMKKSKELLKVILKVN